MTPVRLEELSVPPAPLEDARALARPLAETIVSSPPNSEMPFTSAPAVALARSPPTARAETAIEPVVTVSPADEKLSEEFDTVGGAATAPTVALPLPPGTTIRTAMARAEAAADDALPPADPAAVRAASPSATATRRRR